ncbi:MAG: hypothetical protein Q9169_007867 [Polycauliona sp. 2 TL-2023]
MPEITAMDTMQDYKSSAELLTSKMVVVLAGPNREPYYVHHAILSERSAHCRAALQGPFTEAQSSQIAFPDEQPYVIKLFLHWVYHFSLPHCHYPMDVHRYVALMSFSRSILLEDLQNTCMDSIREAFREKLLDQKASGISGKDLSLAYETTPELHKLRFFMCLQAALHLVTKVKGEDEEWMDEQLSQLLEQGGDLALDLPKLLVYCSSLKLSSTSTFVVSMTNAQAMRAYMNAPDAYAHGRAMRSRRQYASRIRDATTGNMISIVDDDDDDDSMAHFEAASLYDPRASAMRPQTVSSTSLRASTLLPAYDCLFHEHHGAANCKTEIVEDSVHRDILKAWVCFDKKPGVVNTTQSIAEGGGGSESV